MVLHLAAHTICPCHKERKVHSIVLDASKALSECRLLYYQNKANAYNLDTIEFEGSFTSLICASFGEKNVMGMEGVVSSSSSQYMKSGSLAFTVSPFLIVQESKRPVTGIRTSKTSIPPWQS